MGTVTVTAELRRCPICDKDLPPKGLLGHVAGKHKLTKEKFFLQYPEEAGIGSQQHKKAVESKMQLIDAGSSDDLERQVLSSMTREEIHWYLEKVEDIFLQIDRDVTLKPRIHSLVSDLIIALRYNKKLLRGSTNGEAINKDLNQAIKEIESRIDSKMKSLGVDRQSKLASRQQSRSTPSSLISAYVDDIQRQPDEVLDTLMIEEERALAEVRAILEKLYFRNAEDIEPTHIGKEDGTGKPAYIPPTIDDIIQRAGVEL
jgi:hypothetical protein